MTNIALVELARGIAIGAHAGQVDKSVAPYILHPARVAASVEGFEAKVLAWLHDVVEDTPVTLEDLRFWGFPESIVLQVDALTHRKNEPREAYYDRILEWPVATEVKLADVADNSSAERLGKLPVGDQQRLVRKYRAARHYLERM